MDYASKQMTVRMLMEYFQSAIEINDASCLPPAFDVLERISNDREYSVRYEMMQQLPQLAHWCRSAPHLLEGVISRHILGIIFKYLKNWDSQTRHCAKSGLLSLLERGLLDEEQIEFQVCPRILHLTTHQVHYLQQTLALICKMGPHIGPQLMEKVFLERFLTLCEHKDSSIRQICATFFAEFCAAITVEQITDKLLPQFTLLCVDNSRRVREACVEVMLSFARYVLPQRQILASLMISFITDDSTTVRMSAYQILGPFIAMFAKNLTAVTQNKFGELVYAYNDETNIKNNTIPCPSTEGILARSMIQDASPPKMPSNKDMYSYRNVTAKPFEYMNHNNDDDANQNDGASKQFGKAALKKLIQRSVDKTIKEFLENNLVEQQAQDLSDKFEDSKGLNCGSISAPMGGTVGHVIGEEPTTNNAAKDDETTLVDLISEFNLNAQERSRSDARREHFNKIYQKIYNNEMDQYNTFQYYRIPVDESVQREIALFAAKTKPENSSPPKKETKPEAPVAPPVSEPGTNEAAACSAPKAPPDEPEDDNSDDEDEIIEYPRCPEEGQIGGNRGLIKPGSQRSPSPNIVREYVTRTWVDNEIKHPSIEEDEVASNKQSSYSISENKLCIILTKYDLDRGNIVPEILVDFYVELAEKQCTDEANHYCAFSFPAVVMTLGRSNWPLLRSAYEKLASERPWKVRRTIASSIHEIAMILGDEIAAKDLIPIYHGFIKDLDEVRIGALNHLATFLKVLRRDDRTQILLRLDSFLPADTEVNWRYRKVLVEQLLESIVLFHPNDVWYHISAIALQLLNDKVAAVRKAAISLVTKITIYLRSNADNLLSLMKLVRERFARSKKWVSRQTFALLCCDLVINNAIDGKIFAKELLPYLLNLSYDKVPNVRLVVARTLAHEIVTLSPDWLGTAMWHEVDRLVHQMQQDMDRDVRLLASGRMYEF